MPGVLLEGAPLAAKIKESLKPRVKELRAKGLDLNVCAVQITDDPSSVMYVKQQAKAFEEIGVGYDVQQLPATSSYEEVVKAISESNQNRKITGIILQTPLPDHLPQNKLQSVIDPKKDIEGVHPFNLGLIVYGQSQAAPCTALAALALLQESGVELKGKEAVILGRSEIVGTPLALLLLKTVKNSPTVTVCHTGTRDLLFHTTRADILIAAVGRPHFVKGEMIKQGAVVIDVGTHRVPILDKQGNPVSDENGKLKKKTVGDVDFERALERCSFITPVPGGVGPVTVAQLLKKAVDCVEQQF